MTRRIVLKVGLVLMLLAALGNALGTRGRHFGWLVLSAVVALAVAGY